jgi:hypothetical protein
MISVRTPIWNANTGRREIGLAVHKILQEDEIVQVQIEYTRKDGSKIYPNIFEISKGNLVGYREEVRKGVRIMIIPIDKFKEVIVR